MRQTLEFLGHKIEAVRRQGAFWSLVYLNDNVRIWSNPQLTKSTAIGIGKLNLLKWQTQQNPYPAGITLLSNRHLPIIYRNPALTKLLDELGIADRYNFYQDLPNFLKSPHPQNKSARDFIERLQGSLGKAIEIPELNCQVFSWSIPLPDRSPFPANQSTPAPDSHTCETYPKLDDAL
jgi:hypothetical protein